MVKKKKGDEKVFTMTEPVAMENAGCESDLLTLLAEVKDCEGVVGYILRNQTSALIDLEDSAKITDYALLSSLTFEASRNLSDVFDLGDIRNIFFEGKNIKILTVTTDDNKVSVFMEKSADVEKVLEKLQTS
jgi:predicted regulator of Ras-like GTPase activity (Roadblock/LC7/MglB family)